jgi:GTP cyclohydrolase I
MSSYDPELGRAIGTHLVKVGCETPFSSGGSRGMFQLETVEKEHNIIMRHLGLDLLDDSLKDTPQRVAKMYCEEIFVGLDYNRFPKCSTFPNTMKSNELITIKGASVMSMCEHHFVPFIGSANVAYIPSTKLLGLSKIPRVVDFFSRRPQVQERLTLQIFHALQLILETDDIAVTMEAEHMCMRLRGVKERSSTTITSQMGGRFMSKPELRQEFLTLVRS